MVVDQTPQGMKAALTILKKALSSRWFWYAVAAILVLLLLRKYWPRIKGYFARDFGNYTEGFLPPGSTGTGPAPAGNDPVSARQEELRAIARSTYEAIQGAGFQTEAIEALSLLNDTELRYVAEFYRDALTRGTSLSEDIDNEWMWDTDVDDTVIARLRTLSPNL